MSRARPANLAASVRQRLLNMSVTRREDPNLTLTRYALERLLYRLAESEYAGQFILKGAMLFALWTKSAHRPTRDLDLLGFGKASRERLTAVFHELCRVEVEPDGLEFDPDSIRIAEIREGQSYQGQRVKMNARLGNANIPVQVDIGFGDVVTPSAQAIDYPTMLTRTGRGLYVATDADISAHHGLAQAAKRVPHGVICLLSALQFHELGTQSPFEVWMALDRRAARPRIDYPPLHIVRFSGPALTEGMEDHAIEGVQARIYSAAKTVADCFKYRNKIGLDVALEALRDCREQKKCSNDDLWHYAKICRVSNVMRPYLEATA